ncbi:primosomal protein N' [Propionibacteriaceae bacterium Y1700]|uniref:primosomal protein N' n=1 Tax=Microlunatus sp. Y1700 TaxID=3418487 RepID=UPI003DA74518
MPEDRRYARVAVDVSLAHLDRPFDYLVPPSMLDEATVGCRVRVRFAGRMRDGFILELTDQTDADRVQPLEKVVSAEPVLLPEIVDLVRAVADHYAGSFSDVVRLAVPSRHATTEKAAPRQRKDCDLAAARSVPHPFGSYRGGPEFLNAVADGSSPRAAWQVVPTADPAGDWTRGFAAAAAAALASGRGALAVVPDRRDLDRLSAVCAEVLGTDAFVVLTADLGPSARYRAFLAAARGHVKVVIGTRAAALAPVQDLGLVAIWDDGDDLHAEPRAPYPHVREVLALRAAQQRAATLFASYGRTCEVTDLVERGWLRDLVAERPALRRLAPRTWIAADTDFALERDPAARAARVPREVFEVIRTGLAAGPVLVQVPRAGYLASLVCATCREPVRCQHCQGPVRVQGPPEQKPPVSCGWCGRLQVQWACRECGDTHWRAPVVGAARTADELGKAFPGVPIRRSAGEKVLADVPDEPALVVCTPGAEPVAEHGYAAAVLLDAHLLLQRMDLRAPEEALRRWLNAAALVRSGADGGTAIAVGPADSAPLQAFVRVDPAGAAERELVDRAEAGFPPVAKLITVDGPPGAVDDLAAQLTVEAERLGPVDIDSPPHSEESWVRLTLRAPRGDGPTLVKGVRDAAGVRSAKKSAGAVRIRVDPQVIA